MKTITGALSVLLTSWLLAACSPFQPKEDDTERYSEYSFGCTGSIDETRSDYFADGSDVNNYCLFFYIGGRLKYAFYSPDGGLLRVQFLESDQDSEMLVYALANVGNLIGSYAVGSDVDELLSYKQSFVSLASLDGIPASYTPDSPIVPSRDLEGRTTIIPAVPLMARFNISLSVNNAEYPGKLHIKSVSCYNINKEVSAFGSGDTATEVLAYGDCLSAGSDISAFERGSSVSFYVPENLQGSISNPTNDYRLKMPSNGLCTYTIVEAEYASDMAVYSLEYVFYLGEDLYTSFNIERNREYNLYLSLDLSDPYLFGQEPATPDYDSPEQGPYVNRLEEVRYRLAAVYEGEPASTISCNTNDEIELSFRAVGDLYRGETLTTPSYRVFDIGWQDINWDNESDWNILQLSDYVGQERLVVNSPGDEICNISSEFKGFEIQGSFEVRAEDGHVSVVAMESETDLRVEVYNYYRHRPVSLDIDVEVRITGRADKSSDLEDEYMVPQYETSSFSWSGSIEVGANTSAHALDIEGKIAELADIVTSKYIICDSDKNGDELPDYGGWAVFYRFYTVEVTVSADSRDEDLVINSESAFREVRNDSYSSPMVVGENTLYDESNPSLWPGLTPRY